MISLLFCALDWLALTENNIKKSIARVTFTHRILTSPH
jgi:hypothetical protein